jgi:hypothetical protein
LHRRLVEVGQRGIAVRTLGGNRAGEMRITRFLRNAKVSVEEMIEHATAATAARLAGRHILAIQDTSTLRDDGQQRSIAIHPTLAVDAESGVVLGLLHAELLRREGGQKRRRKSLPFSAKESARWLRGAEAAADLCSTALRVTVVADREADIYEAFAARPATVDLLVRACHDRLLEGGERLFALVAGQAEAGRLSVALPAAPGRPAREAVLALRFIAVEIEKPELRASGRNLPQNLKLHLVEACEVNPPPGATPAHWRLLTTHHVESFEQARWIVGLYRRRWLIEELFRTLKTRGFDLERVGIAEGPFEKLAAAALIAAVSVLQLTRERDGQMRRPLQDVFHPDEQAALELVSLSLEGKTAKQKNPHPRGTLAFAAWVCARLGGWTGYYGKPGPIVMLNGLQHFKAMQQGWNLAKHV